MSDFLAAVGLLFVFEGLLYGGFPSAAKRLASEVTGLPEQTMRLVGLASMVFGLGIVWLVRG
jgi:uncharacterized protein YjeT (DUF2065 family)